MRCLEYSSNIASMKVVPINPAGICQGVKVLRATSKRSTIKKIIEEAPKLRGSDSRALRVLVKESLVKRE